MTRYIYPIGLNKEQITYLKISKQTIVGVDPITEKPLDLCKRFLCMDWCTYDPCNQIIISHWFKVL